MLHCDKTQSPPRISSAKPVTDASFEQEVLKSSLPVLVDFWAPWCGPCRMVAQTIEECANEYKESLRVFKLNIDENTLTPDQYGIRSIPTLLLFKNGVKIDTIVGAVPKATLIATLTKHI